MMGRYPGTNERARPTGLARKVQAMLDAYIELKMGEVTRLRMATHPIEFEMYYSL